MLSHALCQFQSTTSTPSHPLTGDRLSYMLLPHQPLLRLPTTPSPAMRSAPYSSHLLLAPRVVCVRPRASVDLRGEKEQERH